jgi:hypothetical protein
LTNLSKTSEKLTWVWRSTRESIAANVPSGAAIIETCLAVPAYWWLAIHFETYFFLATSAFVAPLVLLRSDQSVAFGVSSFLVWETHRWRDNTGSATLAARERLIVWGVLATAAAIGALAAYVLTRYLLIGTAGWAAFLGGLSIACLVIAGTGAPAGAVAGAVAGAGDMAFMLAPSTKIFDVGPRRDSASARTCPCRHRSTCSGGGFVNFDNGSACGSTGYCRRKGTRRRCRG